jgi:hypothetical protein
MFQLQLEDHPGLPMVVQVPADRDSQNRVSELLAPGTTEVQDPASRRPAPNRRR